ncbi:sporulation protein YjcZ [Ammoniphilus sp. YIM 78166]|nr:sporulation protein YjcZ [Ammoniphilus sp. YIM 78166]
MSCVAPVAGGWGYGIGFILVLYILLVIVARPGFFY